MNVGKRIKRMREAQDLTREQVAEMTGFEASAIDAIESGDEVPSIGAVLKLSRALGSQMGQMIHEGGTRSDIFSICHSDESVAVDRAKLTGQGYDYKSLLASDIRGQGMEPFLITFDPKAAETVTPMAHEGEEFIHVMTGTLEIEYDGEKHLLKKGDSLYIDSSRPHAVRGMGKTPPMALAVIYSRG
jgi:transcriptional regulator with XRE-family HTH domain